MENITFYQIEKVNGIYCLVDESGNNIGANNVRTSLRRDAFKSNTPIKRVFNQKGLPSYRLAKTGEYIVNKNKIGDTQTNFIQTSQVSTTSSLPVLSHLDITNFIHSESFQLKPNTLFITELKWKYLIRSVMRGKNIMMTGPSGTGKTFAVQSVIKSLNRPYFYFNLGSTQDARASLVGNTHFDKNRGTFFSESAFVKAIKTPNAIILLDELSRAHPEAWNILMTVLDQGQRYLRLDEADGSPTITVAEGVTFIATANIGNEYTSTRVIDRAIMDRFVTIEMDVLTTSQEFELLKQMYPTTDEYVLQSIAEIASHTRTAYYGSDAKLATFISTRVTVEMTGLIHDGFTLAESAEICIYPFFSNDGGIDSERTYVKQLVQKYIKTDIVDELFEQANGTNGSSKNKVVW